jgi:hypothetical protein
MKLAAALAIALLSVSAAAQDSSTTARGEVFDKLPYWPGYWVGEGSIGTAISGIGRVAENRTTQTPAPSDSIAIWNNNAPWNEEGRRRVAEVQRNSGGRKGLGWGFPLMMNSSTPVQFLITPEEVLIVNAYNEVRHVYTDGRDHPPLDDLWPTVTGNSTGHWEGETLVIDTIMVTNPNEFFQGNPPLSEEARYVERIRLDGDRLVSQITVTDPVTLAGPWIANTALVREEAFDRMIQVDWNNDRTGVDGDVNTIEPPKD